METGTSDHEFPMTVALTMGRASAATYERVVQRTIGTLFELDWEASFSVFSLFFIADHAPRTQQLWCCGVLADYICCLLLFL
jgi:hypothetical protein